jgi:nucleoside-diphosphate-sugar epimerase
MRIFITGASGFVGGAATSALIGAGHEVLAMSRSARSDIGIRELGAVPVRCDLETITSDHISDCQTVIHCAAYVEAWGPKDAWYKANVAGTRTMLDVALAAGVSRFIHIGTEAAICHGQDLHDADETVPLAPDSPYPYCATKAQAEQLVREANRDGFTTIILRPRFIWGPGDTTLLPLIEAMAGAGKWMWINHGRSMTSTTHIDNLVHAITLSLTQGVGGSAYFILDDGGDGQDARSDLVRYINSDLAGGFAWSKRGSRLARTESEERSAAYRPCGDGDVARLHAERRQGRDGAGLSAGDIPSGRSGRTLVIMAKVHSIQKPAPIKLVQCNRKPAI